MNTTASAIQLPLLEPPGPWIRVDHRHRGARELADRHYSRRTVGDVQFTPPGRKLVLLSPCGRAVWAVVHNRDPGGAMRWRCCLFRNEGAGLSSALIDAATKVTFAWWEDTFGLPGEPLRTEVDPGKIRHKRDPGRCFRRAGWLVVGWTAGGHGRARLLVLEAPGEAARAGPPDAGEP